MMLALRDGLRQRGHDARLFASSAQAEQVASLADYDCFGTTSSLRTLVQTANPWATQRLGQVLAEFQPHVVHVRIFLTQLSPLILPLLKPFTSLYHVAWYRSICPLGTKLLPTGQPCHHSAGAACLGQHCLPLHDWLPLMLQMKLWQHWREVFALVVANSEAVKHHLMAEGIAPVEVIGNGIPIRPPRLSLSVTPTIAFAGRLVWEKGVDVLLRAFAQVVASMPEAQLLIAGDGPEREPLISLIADLNLQQQVSLLGHLSRPEMEQRFAHAWVQVVPSRWAEPFGIVAAEAMMRGTAVIATRMGGLAEIVRDGETGLLIPPNDGEALATALLRILSDRQIAEQMGKIGHDTALTHFSETTFIDKFIHLYQVLLEKGKIDGN